MQCRSNRRGAPAKAGTRSDIGGENGGAGRTAATGAAARGVMAETIAHDGHGVGMEKGDGDLAPLPRGGGPPVGQDLEEHPPIGYVEGTSLPALGAEQRLRAQPISGADRGAERVA